MNKKAVALLLALFILILANLLVIAFLELITTDLQIASNHKIRNQAVYIGEAGIEYAISRLRTNKNWGGTAGAIEFPLGSGNTYNVTYTLGSGTISSTATLTSGYQVTAEARVSVTGSSPFRVKILSWREL